MTTNTKNYLIIGGIGGIGRAMVEQLISNNNQTQIFATYYRNVPDLEADNLHWLPMDVSNEDSIEQGIETIKQQTDHIDWVVNCVGLLHNEQTQPEKHSDRWRLSFFYRICKLMLWQDYSLLSISNHY